MIIRRTAAAALLALAAIPTSSHANALTQDACPGTITPPQTFVPFGTGNVLENLLFADGSLWVSDSKANVIHRVEANGSHTVALSLNAPGAMVEYGGLIYAGYGDAIAGAAQRTNQAGIVVFSPSNPAGDSVYASGMHMVNGMSVAPNGDLYTSNDVDSELNVVPAANPSSWHSLADVWGTNGLVVDGDSLYAAITFDQRSPIEKVALDGSGTHHTAYQLSFGAVDLKPSVHTDGDPMKPLAGVKGLDDMTTDGTYLYAAANGMGELIRVNIATGDACLLASGLNNPSSVRIASEGFSLAGSAMTFYVTEFAGNVKRIGYTP